MAASPTSPTSSCKSPFLSASAILTFAPFPWHHASAHLSLCMCCFFYLECSPSSLINHPCLGGSFSFRLQISASLISSNTHTHTHTEWVQTLLICSHTPCTSFPYFYTESLSCVLFCDDCPWAAVKSLLLISPHPAPRVGIWQHRPHECRNDGTLVLLPGKSWHIVRFAMVPSLQCSLFHNPLPECSWNSHALCKCVFLKSQIGFVFGPMSGARWV